MANIKCGNCHGTHGSVGEVRDCYAQSEYDGQQAQAELEAERRAERYFEEGPHGPTPEDPREVELQMMDDLRREEAAAAYKDEEARAAAVLDKMTGAPGRDMASDKQVRYALDLLAARVWPDKLTEQDLRNMERRQVSKLIDNLKHAPRKQEQVVDVLDVGMYRAEDGTILRCYVGQKSGINLVKQIVMAGEADGGYSYQYVGSAAKVVAGRTALGKVKLTRMTLDEAKEWGRMTGTCVVCGRRLDVPESVEAGIGPVCATKEW